MTKKSKSLFMVIVLLSMLFQGVLVRAAVEPEISQNIVDCDFSANNIFNSNCTRLSETGDDRYGKSLEIFPTSKASSSSMGFKVDDGKSVIISFDFKAKQIDHIFRLILRDSGVTFGAIYWTHGGKILFSTNGAEFYNIKSDEIPTNAVAKEYDTNWHNITIKIVPNSINTSLNYYYDGLFAGTANVSASGSSVTGVLKSMYLTSTQTGYNSAEENIYDGSEALYLDNFSVLYDEGIFTANANLVNNSVKIVFNEIPKQNCKLDDVAIVNTKTGDSEEIKNITQYGRNLEVLLSSDIENNTEYGVLFPDDFESATGKHFYGGRVHFLAKSDSDGKWNVLKNPFSNYDFSDLPVGAATDTEEWKNVINTKSNYIKGVSCEDIGGIHEKVIKYTGTEDSGHLRIIGGDAWQEDEQQKRVVVSMDLCRTELKRTPDIKIMLGTACAGSFFLDSYGRLVVLSGITSSNEDTDGIYPEGHIVYEMNSEVGTWNTITLNIDKEAQKITYYVDGNEFDTADFCTTTNAGVKEIRFSQKNSTKDDRSLLIDNVKLYHVASSDTVTQVRLIERNGDRYAPSEKDVPTTLARGTITFSTDVQPDSVNTDTIKINSENDDTDITIDSVSQNFATFTFDRFLKKNNCYTITVDGVEDGSGNILSEYTSEFTTDNNGSVYVENFGIKNGNQDVTNLLDVSTGNDLYVSGTVVNTTDNDVIIYPMINLYNGFIVKYVKGQQITVNANSIYDIKQTDATLTYDAYDTTELSATITMDKFKPLVDAITLKGSSEFVEDDWSIVYNKNIGIENAGKRMFVDILLPGKTQTDIHDGVNINTIIAYRGQTIVDNNGNISIKCKLFDDQNIDGDAISGKYNIIATSEDGTIFEDKIEFSNCNEAENLRKILNATAKDTTKKKEENIQTISEIINKNLIALGIPEKNAIGVDFLNVATMLYDYINHTSELKDISGMNVVLNRIILINSISQKQISNLFEYKEDLQLSQSDIGTLYTLNFVTEKMQKDISDDLSGSSFSTISEFFDALTENFVLRAIENPDGSTNAKTVIMTLYKQIGIDNELINNASESVYRNVSNHYYSDYQALKKAFEDACNSKNNSNNGGVGTGKGSSNTGGNSIAAPNQNTSHLIQELPHDIFNDIAGVEWAKEAIVNLAEKGIIAGKGNNEFYPNDNITREEFVKMVVAAFFEDVEPKEISFSDITDDSWSKIYIMKAYGCGIISGYSDDLFGAKNHVTRQDMAVILYRAALKKGIEFDASSSKTFQDENELPEYAIEAVNKLYNANIINGIESDVFGGRALATRAQAAKMIFGLISE